MNKETVILGYDLGSEYTQISALVSGEKEPETFSTVSGEDKFQIPTMLGKVTGSDQWVYGMEAKKLVVLGEGTAVDRLLEHCIEKEPVEIEGKKYEPVWLLAKFLEQTMQFVYRMIGNRPVTGLMFTVPRLNEDIAAVIRTAAARLEIAREAVYLQDYEESFYHFVVNSNRELWHHSVALFTYEQNRIDYSLLSAVTKNRMQYITVEKKGYLEIEPYENRPELGEDRLNREKDEAFAGFIRRHFGKQLISSVYLIGDGFDDEWMEESLKVLCAGRRVFLGRNLYTKGACYGGLECSMQKVRFNRLYCGPHKVLADIGLRMRVKGSEAFYPLVEAGKNWFEAASSCEFILTGTNQVELEIKSYLTGTTRKEVISLEELPERPPGTMRIRLELLLLDQQRGRVIVSDVGFGEMYPATAFTKQQEIRLD